MNDDKRTSGRLIDLDMLEEQAKDLYLHRFVEAIRKTRGDHGRFLFLRAGDEVAISAADDGSTELLEQVTVLEDVPDDEDD